MDAMALRSRVEALRGEGYRLLMINATALLAKGSEGLVEIAWSFEKAGELVHLTERVTTEEEVPSVSAHYPFAYLYENEIVELFGVNVVGRNVDFKGELYQTPVKVPMSLKAIRARLEASQGKGTKST
jgi:ech hydrogenase subunit D